MDAVRGAAHEEKDEGGYLRGGHSGEQGQLTNPEPSLLPSTASWGPLLPAAWTHLAGLVVDQEDEQQGGQVEHGKDVLGHADVSAPASGIIQPHKDVHKAGWVPGRGVRVRLPSLVTSQPLRSSLNPLSPLTQEVQCHPEVGCSHRSH